MVARSPVIQELTSEPGDDEMDDFDHLKYDFGEELDAFETKSSFYATAVLPEGNPGLTIEGLGRFGVALSQPEVRRIISKCRHAPFGKGSDTIVDTAVRNTW